MTQPGALPAIRPGRALTISMGVSIGIQLMNLVTGVLLARSLGPVGRGELTAVLLWPSLLAALGSLGMSDALTFHAARRSATSGELIGTGTAIGLLQSAALVCLGLVLEPIVLQHYGAETVRSGLLLLGFIPLYLVILYLMGVINGQQRIAAYHVLRGFLILSTVVALAVVAAFGELTVLRAVIAYLIAYGTTLALALGIVFKGRPRPQIDRALARELIHYGIRSHASSVSLLLNARLDQLLVSLFLASQLLGLYTVGVTLSMLTFMIGFSMALVALPLIARLEPGPARQEQARVMVSVTFFLSAGITLPLLLFTPQLIDLVFGEAFVPAATPARLLLAASVLVSTNRALEAILKAIGRPMDAGVAEAVALAVTLLGLALLLPTLGLAGAGLASVLAAATSGLLLTRRTSRALGVRVRELYFPHRGDLQRASTALRGIRPHRSNSTL